MPQSKKDIKRLKQKQNLENGIVYQKKAPETSMKCTICKVEIRVTKTNTEIKSHAASKHTKEGLAICFPELEEQQEA